MFSEKTFPFNSDDVCTVRTCAVSLWAGRHQANCHVECLPLPHNYNTHWCFRLSAELSACFSSAAVWCQFMHRSSRISMLEIFTCRDDTILGELAELRKSTIKFRHVCSSAWNNWLPTERIFMTFDIWGFSKMCRENSSFVTVWQE